MLMRERLRPAGCLLVLLVVACESHVDPQRVDARAVWPDLAPAGESGARPLDDAEIVDAAFPSELACGGTAKATVRVRNTGTATWTRAGGYKLGAVDDSDPFRGPDTRVWLSETASVPPGATHSFELGLVAPSSEGVQVTDWQMVHEGVAWFGARVSRSIKVSCAKRRGPVRLSGNSLKDDGGEFNALGATLFWAAWAYKQDRPRLEAALALLQQHGFDYIRALGVVGDPNDPSDAWAGRIIDWHWPDYQQVIAGLTDLAYDKYGLRVQWTLIGDGQKNLPSKSDRYQLADWFLAMSKTRAEKIILLEVANEYWQNGFAGSEGLADLRALTTYVRDRTDILVAASAPTVGECPAITEVYQGGIADIATVHFDRDVTKVDGHWRPVRQPWGYFSECSIPTTPSNNEPIGPGSSVHEEKDPTLLVAGALMTYLANSPMYVYHTVAGVWGKQDLAAMPGLAAVRMAKTLVPGDVASWARKNAHWADAPFRMYAVDAAGKLVADAAWPDLAGAQAGAVRTYAQVSGTRFVACPFGIKDRVVLEPRKAVELDVLDPMTGAKLSHHTLAAGQQLELKGGAFFLLVGDVK